MIFVKISPTEKLFTVINETANILQEELSCTYLEALAETGENLFQQALVQEEISELGHKRLEKHYREVNVNDFTNEEKRKAFQLAILKGMKENVQPNHQMTPDAVGMLIAYLVNKFMNSSSYRLLDPAVGTGNLLTTILNYEQTKNIDAIGVDVDDLLIHLAYDNANLQEHPVELFTQDSLEPLFVDPVDAVVCDVPVGFYPNDVRAADYFLKADTGHSYSHHLFIEQSLRYTKPGGYLFFLVPNGLFESDQAAKLHQYLKEHAFIQGFLQLPETLFKNKQAAKSIFILQKKGENIKAPKQALLVNLPSLSQASAMEKILQNINEWIRENKMD